MKVEVVCNVPPIALSGFDCGMKYGPNFETTIGVVVPELSLPGEFGVHKFSKFVCIGNTYTNVFCFVILYENKFLHIKW